ncbi:hypothetical protein EYF80_008129 [Liparis tanakae]|uniref:Uncharacterized protein n=1 Tax=Liparis tanakae TaxID=230148 RepID=A0A4Z2IWP9_9TELE|nr:hypothetical protein EYF80_008129 [Liparis tanakae]
MAVPMMARRMMTPMMAPMMLPVVAPFPGRRKAYRSSPMTSDGEESSAGKEADFKDQGAALPSQSTMDDHSPSPPPAQKPGEDEVGVKEEEICLDGWLKLPQTSLRK